MNKKISPLRINFLKLLSLPISIGVIISAISCSSVNQSGGIINPPDTIKDENPDTKNETPEETNIPPKETSPTTPKESITDNPIDTTKSDNPKNENPKETINPPQDDKPTKPTESNKTGPMDKSSDIKLTDFAWFNEKQKVFVKAPNNVNRISEEKLYQSIYDRTFTVGFNTNLPESDGIENVVGNFTQGTGWLLDYAWEVKDKELVLFIATNAHVYAGAVNAIDYKYKTTYPEYFASLGNLTSFNFGKALDQTVKIQPTRNDENVSSTNKYTTLTNDNKSATSSFYNQLHQSDLFDNPQTVFVANNFLDEKSNQQLSDENHAGIIKDFAVFSLRIHYDKFNTSNNQTVQAMKSAIDKAINALDESLKIIDAQNRHHDNINYIDIDQPSLYNYLDVARAVKFDEDNYDAYKNSYTQLNKLYIGGYPNINYYQVYLTNNPSNLNSSNQAFDRRSFSNGIEVDIFGRKYSGIGQIAIIENSSLHYGASGSIVLNEFGLINGIYSVTKDGDTEFDRSKKGGFTFLVQDFDLYADSVKDENRIVYAHNLIDGSDKSRYPKQRTSYRQNLKAMLSDYKFTKTALFKDGV